MVYYASTIFQALGFQSGDKATLASLGIGIAKVSSQHLYVILGDPGAVNRGARKKIGGTKGCTNTDVLVNFRSAFLLADFILAPRLTVPGSPRMTIRRPRFSGKFAAL